MNQRNYQKEYEQLVAALEKKAENNPEVPVPRLFLHSCCAPCSSYCLEYLTEHFDITDYFYNPNISPKAEYDHRTEELKRMVAEMKQDGTLKHSVEVVEGVYDPERFYAMAKGLEKVPEGGERCFKCYELRLREAAKLAKEGNYDYFCTTLSISPLKNADKLMEIGENLANEYGIQYLPSNFKKKNGYKRSIELSAKYDLYRQNFCGCVYSKAASEKRHEPDPV